MRAYVWASRNHRSEADALAEKLRAGDEFGGVVRLNARYYDGTVDADSVVYHDGSRRDLMMAHEDSGVELRPIPGTKAARTAAVDPAVSADPDYRVEMTSSAPEWWKVLDADGEQVGKAHRSEEAALAALEEITG